MVAYSFKRRFVAPIQVGLGQIEHIPGTEYTPKRQTIRAIGKRRHARPGETLQLYSGMRTKQCFSIGVARCTSARGIKIFVEGGQIRIDGESDIINPASLDHFARGDGFKDWVDMQAFWRAEHGGIARLGPFVGVLIMWEPLG